MKIKITCKLKWVLHFTINVRNLVKNAFKNQRGNRIDPFYGKHVSFLFTNSMPCSNKMLYKEKFMILLNTLLKFLLGDPKIV